MLCWGGDVKMARDEEDQGLWSLILYLSFPSFEKKKNSKIDNQKTYKFQSPQLDEARIEKLEGTDIRKNKCGIPSLPLLKINKKKKTTKTPHPPNPPPAHLLSLFFLKKKKEYIYPASPTKNQIPKT